MANKKNGYICTKCKNKSSGQLRLCPYCQSTGTYVENIEQTKPTVTGAKQHITVAKPAGVANSKVQLMRDVTSNNTQRYSTTIQELDRVLGGGIVPGSIMLLGGSPGAGKSSLLLKVSSILSNIGTVLYVSGEESESQIKMRHDRLSVNSDALYVVYETELEEIINHINTYKPTFLIVDSINTIASTEIASASGSPTQLKYCANQLRHIAKTSGLSIFLVGQVTKEGDIAGPNSLAHDVDAVLYLEGDQFQMFRLLRAEKNRFGSTGEVGIFEMAATGLEEVVNPSLAFMGERRSQSGSCPVVIMEGSRPLTIEMQALSVSTSNAGMPARRGSGINKDRMFLICAVLDKYVKFIDLQDHDVLVNVAGGLKVQEPAVDLAMATAIVSSWHDIAMPNDTIVVGEIGLTGELRPVMQIESRLREARSLGFNKIIVPKMRKGVSVPDGLQVIQCETIETALMAIFKGLIDFDV